MRGGGAGATIGSHPLPAVSESLTVSIDAPAADTRARLLDAWPLFGPLIDAWARRAARAVRGLAEAQSSSSSS